MIKVVRVPSYGTCKSNTMGRTWSERLNEVSLTSCSHKKFPDTESLLSEIDLASLSSSGSESTQTATTHTTSGNSNCYEESLTSCEECNELHTTYVHQEQYLQFVEPSPVFPPHYSTLPPGGCPRFPILDSASQSDDLPAYSPAVYKLGLMSRKVEWLSPFQPASSRSWKKVLVELNSTQVNIYGVPSNLESVLFDLFQGICHLETSQTMDTAYSSIFTSLMDLKLRNLCVQIGILPPLGLNMKHLQVYNSNCIKLSDDYSTDSLQHCCHKSNSAVPRQLIRSYSLLHAKVGLASDYNKKPNVLRLRLENEQFLHQCSLTRDLIDWHLGLCVGQDVSADILERDPPRYRTVPRRRRGQVYAGNRSHHSNVMRSLRARSNSVPISQSSIRSKLHSVKQRIRSHSSTELASSEYWNALVRNDEQQHLLLLHSVHSNERLAFEKSNRSRSVNSDNREIGSVNEFHRPSDDDEVETDEDDDDNENDNEDDDDTLEHSPVMHGISPPHLTSVPSTSSKEVKSAASNKFESERRFLRNCVKCIKPLCFDEPWTNKTLVKATSLAPLDLRFSKQLYSTLVENSELSALALLSQHEKHDKSPKSMKSRKRSIFLKHLATGNSHLPICMPNHNLREYVVGTHLLVPKEL